MIKNGEYNALRDMYKLFLYINELSIRDTHMKYICKHLKDYITNRGLEFFNDKDLKPTSLISKILAL